MASVWLSAQHLWVSLDDTVLSLLVQHAGQWSDILQTCTSGRLQPLLVFYKRVGVSSVGWLLSGE